MIKIYKRNGFALGHLTQLHYHWYEIDIGFYVLSIQLK